MDSVQLNKVMIISLGKEEDVQPRDPDQIVKLNEDVELGTDGLPSRIRLFSVGDNTSTKGTIVYDPSFKLELEDGQNGQEHLCVDIAHGTMNENAPPESHEAVGWWQPDYADDGVWANMEEWLEAGSSAILGRKFRYISPAFTVMQITDEDGNDVLDENGVQKFLLTGLINFSLTNIPATTNASPLFNDRLATKLRRQLEMTIKTKKQVTLGVEPPKPGVQPKMNPADTDASGVSHPASGPGKQLEDDGKEDVVEQDNDDTSPVEPSMKTPDEMSEEEVRAALEQAMKENSALREELEEARNALEEAMNMYEKELEDDSKVVEEEEDEETKERREILSRLQKADLCTPTQALVLSRLSLEGLRLHEVKVTKATKATPSKKLGRENTSRVVELAGNDNAGEIDIDRNIAFLASKGISYDKEARLREIQLTLAGANKFNK